jgi:hypothetical protein
MQPAIAVRTYVVGASGPVDTPSLDEKTDRAALEKPRPLELVVRLCGEEGLVTEPDDRVVSFI